MTGRKGAMSQSAGMPVRQRVWLARVKVLGLQLVWVLLFIELLFLFRRPLRGGAVWNSLLILIGLWLAMA